MTPPRGPRSVEQDALLRTQPFAALLRIERVEPVGEFSHSGSACFVSDGEGRRFKLRRCRSARRARQVETLVGVLSGLCPRVVARSGNLLLIEALDEHRPLSREALLGLVDRLGAMVAEAHGSAERAGIPGRFGGGFEWGRSRFQLERDLRLLGGERTLESSSWRALLGKLRAHRRRFGLPMAVELDDLHKANLMRRERDGDLRYVDDEGVAIRPLGTSLASLVKTADRGEHWEAFRAGYGRVREPEWITPEYTEYVVLLDTVRKVANKIRGSARLDAERLEKLPAEISDLERVALRERPSLDWGFHRG